jgi:hypothetical protein
MEQRKHPARNKRLANNWAANKAQLRNCLSEVEDRERAGVREEDPQITLALN